MKFCLCIFLAILSFSWASQDANTEEMQQEEVEIDSEKLKYSTGSICGYCDYCKFCKLCDEDCPCEKGPNKPNCHMCKYCKYCYLCSGVCDTVCQPGGFIDKVSAAVANALPSLNTLNKDEVDSDIDGVKTWIDKAKDEL